MTDPEFAIAPTSSRWTEEYVELIIAKERPDALLPTMGGQTALNVAMPCMRRRMERYRRGADRRRRASHSGAEDRALFGHAMREIGLKMPDGRDREVVEDALQLVEEMGSPRSFVRRSRSAHRRRDRLQPRESRTSFAAASISRRRDRCSSSAA